MNLSQKRPTGNVSRRATYYLISGQAAESSVDTDTSTYAADVDGRVTKEEELVHAWYYHSPDNTHDPSPDGRRWHVKVIRVGDC